MDEGAGVDLYRADRAGQVVLLDEYAAFVCAQVGPDCAVNSQTFVLAGMNDIDLRCDGFLTWLDAQRRNREPVISEISAVNTAVHSVMTVTGASPKSLDIVTAAFGLASASYTNWNTRLLISVNQSTVQEVVYTAQGNYRAKIAAWPVPDKPTAIYLLRNYLRLCMPTTIEAAINVSTTLVQREVTPAQTSNLVVSTVQPPGRPVLIRDVNAPLAPFRPTPPPASSIRIGAYEKTMSQKDMQRVVTLLGCGGQELGAAGSSSRKALSKFLQDNGKTASETVTDGVFLDLLDLEVAKKKGTCSV
jgi:hypothetical protein